MALKLCSKGLDNTTCMNRISSTNTQYFSRWTLQVITKAKIVNGRFLLRTQHRMLLPQDAKSQTGNISRIEPKYQHEEYCFKIQIFEYLQFFLKRYDGHRRRSETFNYSDDLPSVRAIVEGIIPHDFIDFNISTNLIPRKGYSVMLTIWLDLGTCQYQMQRPLIRWEPFRLGSVSSSFEGKETFTDKHTAKFPIRANQNAFFKNRVRAWR